MARKPTPHKRAPRLDRWPDNTPRSSNNAFTGVYPTYETGKPTRAQIMNGAAVRDHHRKGVIPWNGPQTVREPKPR